MAATRTRATTPKPATKGHSKFTFEPIGVNIDGVKSGPITVNSVSVAIPEERQRWFFFKIRDLKGLEQPLFWLEQAKVPKPVQEQIMLLPLAEWDRFFKEWMADNGNGATPGE